MAWTRRAYASQASCSRMARRTWVFGWAYGSSWTPFDGCVTGTKVALRSSGRADPVFEGASSRSIQAWRMGGRQKVNSWRSEARDVRLLVMVSAHECPCLLNLANLV